MISKQSAIIILDLLDKRIDEVDEKIKQLIGTDKDEILLYRLKDNLQSYNTAKDELKKEMDRW